MATDLRGLEFASEAKSYKEFVQLARRTSRMLDRRRSGVLHNLDSSRQMFSEFIKQKKLEEGEFIPARNVIQEGFSESETSSDESEEVESNADEQELVSGRRTPMQIPDDESSIGNKKAPHLLQQQQAVSGVALGQGFEMVLMPLYDVELYLHFNKRRRKQQQKLHPYLTRLVNSNNEREFLRIFPVMYNSGYANNSLWSKRSIQVEYMLRPFLVQTNATKKSVVYKPTSNTVDNSATSNAQIQRYIRETISLLNYLPEKSNLSIVDTIWSCDQSNPQRELVTRLASSDGTAQSQSRELAKEQIRQIEFDLFLLNIVNDFTSLYKQIHSPAGLEQFIIDNNILHDNARLIKHLKKKNMDKMTSAFEDINAAHQAQQEEIHLLDNSEALTDGNFKCEGLLIGIAASNHVHIRPLCTSADMSLALNELQDPRVFSCGFITMPHMLQMNLERFSDGFYRMEYHAKDGFAIKYMKLALPTANKELRPFVTLASYTLPLECFHEELLFSTKHDSGDAQSSFDKADSQVDAEAPSQTTMDGKKTSTNKSSRSRKDPARRMRNEDALPPGLLDYCAHLIRIMNDTYQKYTKVILSVVLDIEILKQLKGYQRTGGSKAPHLVPNVDPQSFQFRLLSMNHIEVRDCRTHFRRHAVNDMDGIQRHFLKSFYLAFKKEWTLITKRDHSVETIEDLSQLSSADRTAIKFAMKTYEKMIPSLSSDSESDETGDNNDQLDEFALAQRPTDLPLPRPRTHEASRQLIAQHREQVAREELAKSVEEATKALTQAHHGRHNSTATQGQQNNYLLLRRRDSSASSPTRRQNAAAAATSNKPSRKPRPLSRLRSVDERSTTSSRQSLLDTEVDAYSTLRQQASQNFVDERYNELVEATEVRSSSSALNALGQTESVPMPLSIDPFNERLRTLCDHNKARPYAESMTASTTLLQSDDSSNRRQLRCLPSAVPSIYLSNQESHHEDMDPRLKAFPYLEKFNKAAYKLAERLDVLTLLLADDSSRRLNAKKVSETMSTSVTASDSVTATHNPPTSAENAFSAFGSPPLTTAEIQLPQMASVPLATEPSAIEGNETHRLSTVIRTHLRRFSQRFQGLLFSLDGNEVDGNSESDSSGLRSSSGSDGSDSFAHAERIARRKAAVADILGSTPQARAKTEQQVLADILKRINPRLAARIRKGLDLREAKRRAKQRQKFVRNKRRRMKLTAEQLTSIGEYFATLPQYALLSDASSDSGLEDDSLTDSNASAASEEAVTEAVTDAAPEEAVATPNAEVTEVPAEIRDEPIDDQVFPTADLQSSLIAGSSATADPAVFKPSSATVACRPTSAAPTAVVRENRSSRFRRGSLTTHRKYLLLSPNSDGLAQPTNEDNSQPQTPANTPALNEQALVEFFPDSLLHSLSQPQLWEQMTDSLSTLCDQVQLETQNILLDEAFMAQRSGGLLWADHDDLMRTSSSSRAESAIVKLIRSTGSSRAISAATNSRPATQRGSSEVDLAKNCLEELSNQEQSPDFRVPSPKPITDAQPGAVGVLSARDSDHQASGTDLCQSRGSISTPSMGYSTLATSMWQSIICSALQLAEQKLLQSRVSNSSKENVALPGYNSAPSTSTNHYRQSLHQEFDKLFATPLGAVEEGSKEERSCEVQFNDLDDESAALEIDHASIGDLLNALSPTRTHTNDPLKSKAQTLRSSSSLSQANSAFDKFLQKQKPVLLKEKHQLYDKQTRRLNHAQQPKSMLSVKFADHSTEPLPIKVPLGVKGKTVEKPVGYDEFLSPVRRRVCGDQRSVVPESEDEIGRQVTTADNRVWTAYSPADIELHVQPLVPPLFCDSHSIPHLGLSPSELDAMSASGTLPNSNGDEVEDADIVSAFQASSSSELPIPVRRDTNHDRWSGVLLASAAERLVEQDIDVGTANLSVAETSQLSFASIVHRVDAPQALLSVSPSTSPSLLPEWEEPLKSLPAFHEGDHVIARSVDGIESDRFYASSMIVTSPTQQYALQKSKQQPEREIPVNRKPLGLPKPSVFSPNRRNRALKEDLTDTLQAVSSTIQRR